MTRCLSLLQQPTSAEHSSVNDTCHLLLSILQPFVRMIYVAGAAANRMRRHSGSGEFGVKPGALLREMASEMSCELLRKMNAFVKYRGMLRWRFSSGECLNRLAVFLSRSLCHQHGSLQ